MADSSAAQNMDSSGSELMSASEIDALLAELAESNVEPDPATVATDPLLAEASAEAPALTVEDGGADAAPAAAEEPSLEILEPEAAMPQAVLEPQPPKAFDMEDVLRAASEVTNMSTEEIRNLKSATVEEEPAVEPESVAVDVVDEREPVEATAAVEEPAVSPSAWEDEEEVDVAPAPKKKLKQPKEKAKRSMPKLSLPSVSLPAGGGLSFAISGVALAVAIGALVVGLRAGKASGPSVAAKDKSVAESIAGLETLITNQNERLGRIEDALGGPTSSQKAPVETRHGEEATKAAQTAHGEKATSPGDAHGSEGHDSPKPGAVKEQHGKSDGHDAPADPHAKASTYSRGDSGTHGAKKSHTDKQSDAHAASAPTKTAHQDVPGAEGFRFSGKSLKVAPAGHKTVNAGGKKLVLSTKAPHAKSPHGKASPRRAAASRPTAHRPAAKRKPASRPAAKVAPKPTQPRVKAYLDGIPVN